MDIFIDRHCDWGDGWSLIDVLAADQPSAASRAGRCLVKSRMLAFLFFWRIDYSGGFCYNSYISIRFGQG